MADMGVTGNLDVAGVEEESASRRVRMWLLGDMLAFKARQKSKVINVKMRSYIRGLEYSGQGV